MKKLLLLSMGACLLFASCKKNDAPELTDEKLYEVNFKVGVFNQIVSDFPNVVANSKVSSSKVMATGGVGAAAAPAKLSDLMSNIDYFLYNSEGTQIANRTIMADTSKIGFTLPTANLKAGKYRVVFLGKKGETGATFTPNSGSPVLQVYMSQYYNNNEPIDLFYSNVQFEVGGEDSYVEVNLKRPGGKLKIMVEDEWPSDITKIGLSINGQMVYYLNEGQINQYEQTNLTITKKYKSTYEIINGYPMPISEYLECSYEQFIFTLPTTATTLKGTITAYGKYNDVIVTKSISNIKVENNKITTVKGKLFDDLGFSTKSNFKITVDSDLSGKIDQTF